MTLVVGPQGSPTESNRVHNPVLATQLSRLSSQERPLSAGLQAAPVAAPRWQVPTPVAGSESQ